MFRSREVKTLMGLTGRMSWILASVIIAAIASAKADDLSKSRLIIIASAGGAWIMLHVAAFIFGIVYPDQFHYGAEERLELRRMTTGDSLGGSGVRRASKSKGPA